MLLAYRVLTCSCRSTLDAELEEQEAVVVAERDLGARVVRRHAAPGDLGDDVAGPLAARAGGTAAQERGAVAPSNDLQPQSILDTSKAHSKLPKHPIRLNSPQTPLLYVPQQTYQVRDLSQRWIWKK